MKNFSFSIPQNILVGEGSLEKLPEIVKKLGKQKVFIVSGPHLDRIGLVNRCCDALKTDGIGSEKFTQTEGNPGTNTVDIATVEFIRSHSDVIVALGGGSPIDVAKAVAVLAAYGGSVPDYEGAGKVPGPVVPIIAIPTTAGTGSEVTAFSVITDQSRNYKLTVASDHLLPEYVILDPELIESVPKKTAAACGVDAFVHAFEAYLSLAASPVSDLFAEKAMELIGANIRAYVADRKNKKAAQAMILGSMYAGISFSHARLGNVHAMSHPVSAWFQVPHGVANAILLPVIAEYNMEAAYSKYYDVYTKIEPRPVHEDQFQAAMLIQTLRDLINELEIPATLSAVGVKESSLEFMAEDAMKSGNILVNPRKTTKEDILTLYRSAL